MLFELERIQRIADDIKELCYTGRLPVTKFKVKDGSYKDMPPRFDGDDLHDFTTGGLWGGYDESRWFVTKAVTDKSHIGKCVIMRITTGREGEWDAMNPQAMFYINSMLIQGVDVNHREVILAENATEGEVFEIAILFHSGLHEGRKFLFSTDLLCLRQRNGKPVLRHNRSA